MSLKSGKERISIKIQSPENGVSYTIKPNSFVNVYATIRSDYASNFLPESDRLTLGDDIDGYTVIKILDNTKVLGTFNIDGVEVSNAQDGITDSILLAVTSEEAKEINLLREIASFNITGVTINEKNTESVSEILNETT